MKVSVRIHLPFGRSAFINLGPFELVVAPHHDRLHDFVLDEARQLLSQTGVFSRDLPQTVFYISAPPEVRGVVGLEVEATCDVYCVRLERSREQSASRGARRVELARELQETFGLCDVGEESILPWKEPSPVPQDGLEDLPKRERQFEDCGISSETLYLPGSAFLITSDSRSGEQSSSCSSGSLFYSLTCPVQRMSKAHCETQGGSTSAQDSGQSMVGPFQHDSQTQLAPKPSTKSDLSRRRDCATGSSTHQLMPADTIASPSIIPHKSLTDMPHQTSTDESDVKVRKSLPNIVDCNDELETSTAGQEDISTVAFSSDDRTALTCSEGVSDASQLLVQQQQEREEEMGGIDSQEGSVRDCSFSPPNNRTEMIVSKLPEVAGVKALVIPEERAKTDVRCKPLSSEEDIRRTRSAPTVFGDLLLSAKNRIEDVVYTGKSVVCVPPAPLPVARLSPAPTPPPAQLSPTRPLANLSPEPLPAAPARPPANLLPEPLPAAPARPPAHLSPEPLPAAPARPPAHLSPEPLAPSPARPPAQLPPAAVGSVSFDPDPAQYSTTPTSKSPVQTLPPHHDIGPPLTLHTLSDSPHHHVTHLPTTPSYQIHHPPSSAIVVGQMPVSNLHLESTIVQGTYPPTQQRDTLPVAQATADEPVGCLGPRPHPVAMGTTSYLPISHCPILMSEIPGKFPHRNRVPPNSVIFSRIQSMPVGPVENLGTSSDLLGEGGNGRILTHYLHGECYAVKWTKYRASELSEWRRFDHPNIIPLLMVASLEPDTCLCYQFMPRMDGSLRSVVPKGGVHSLLSEDVERWEREVMPNVRHIVRGVVLGTAYLHEELSLQHVDLKASNVLLKYRCGCGDVFRCVCPEDLKCLVQLSDFDSVKPFQWKEFVNEQKQELDWSLYVHMNSKECKEVMGTPGYRAPEQFLKLAPVVHPDHVCWGKSLEGPWSDIWSLGLLVLSILLGRNTPQDIDKASLLCCKPSLTGFSREDVVPELVHVLVKTQKLLKCCPRRLFTEASDFVLSCTEVEFHKRPTALNLTDRPFLVYKNLNL